MKYQVGAQTETELKEKKLRVEDALNATKVCSSIYAIMAIHSNFEFANHYNLTVVIKLIFGNRRQLLTKAL